jgi:hypothetical protein
MPAGVFTDGKKNPEGSEGMGMGRCRLVNGSTPLCSTFAWCKLKEGWGRLTGLDGDEKVCADVIELAAEGIGKG